MKYDIFLSYRRKSGAERAELLKTVFSKYGYKEERVFMDTHNLRSGDFKDRLSEAIENSSNVVVLITKGCFDDIKENDFWIFEIAKALELKKNIVPVFFDGITSIDGKDLPQVLKDLPGQNAVGYNHEYADAVYEKILSFLVNVEEEEKHDNKSKIVRKVAFASAIVLLLLFVACFAFYIPKQKAINKAKEAIEYCDEDKGSFQCNEALKKADKDLIKAGVSPSNDIRVEVENRIKEFDKTNKKSNK